MIFNVVVIVQNGPMATELFEGPQGTLADSAKYLTEEGVIGCPASSATVCSFTQHHYAVYEAYTELSICLVLSTPLIKAFVIWQKTIPVPPPLLPGWRILDGE